MEPTIININDINYYNADELKEYDVAFFAKTSKTIRQIIERKNIPKEEYGYFCFNKKENKWKESNKDKPSAKAKLLIKAGWSKENIPKFNEENSKDDNEKDNLNVIYEKLPQVLELKEEEKFKDVNNISLNIEVRGTRNLNSCYFNVGDISKCFDMKKIKDVITDKRYDGYIENKHYKFFTSEKLKSPGSPGKKSSKKYLYLTYLGLTRLLFVSKNPNCEHFQNWAINILFTHQLGTQEQKQVLSNKLLGKSVKSAIDVFKTSCKSIPSIYLLTLGKASDLKKSFNIPKDVDNETILCKYGKTENLERRLIEHNNDYGKIKGVELRLKYYSFIDPEFITDAENQLKNFFIANNMKFEHLERNELVLINTNLMKNTLKTYELVYNSCSGSVKEINSKIKNLEQQLEINNLKHENELKNKDFELKNKDFEFKNKELKYQNELKEREAETEKLKTELKHQQEIMKLKEQIYNLQK